MKMKRCVVNIILKNLLYVVVSGLTLFFCRLSPASLPIPQEKKSIRLEANYILACQFIDPQNPAHGCINNVYGAPTWVVPRENAMAILGLIIAGEMTNRRLYIERAQLAADYLVRIQDINDGAWANQYEYCTVVDYAKSPTQTAEVMIAFYKLGYNPSRYESMILGAEYLLQCQDVANKGGNDDGLVCGGKDEKGNWYPQRWTHDNSYAYQALMAASKWARLNAEPELSIRFRHAALRILEGINEYLKDSSSPGWYIAIDEWGNPQQVWPKSWISWSPVMLDVPAEYDSEAVVHWIHNEFQMNNGGCIGYDRNDAGELALREYPGITMQACLCWLDLGGTGYILHAYNWIKTCSLWQIEPDTNGVIGGFIDWVEIWPNPNATAPKWQRFIDTSFYAITFLSGGYDFSCCRKEDNSMRKLRMRSSCP